MSDHPPTWFVVTHGLHGETGSLYYDHLPDVPKQNTPRIYTLRLDTLPLGERWCAMSLDELMAAYRRLKDRGKLPQTTRPPSAAAEKPHVKLGHRETMRARPGHDLPPEGWADPDAVKPKAEHWIVSPEVES